MAKKVKIGSLLLNEVEFNGVKKKLLSVGLGSKNKNNPQYDQTVEIIVRDNTGKIIAQQRDGFLEVVDPRKEPDELLAAGLISEEIAEKMKENVSKLPEKIKYQLRMRSTA